MRKLSPSRPSPLLAPSFLLATPKCQVPAMCYGPNKLLGPRRAGPGPSLRSRARGWLQLGRVAGWAPLLSRDRDAPRRGHPDPATCLGLSQQSSASRRTWSPRCFQGALLAPRPPPARPHTPRPTHKAVAHDAAEALERVAVSVGEVELRQLGVAEQGAQGGLGATRGQLGQGQAGALGPGWAAEGGASPAAAAG